MLLFVTTERLVAVYFPIKFSEIVTKTRTMRVAAALFVLTFAITATVVILEPQTNYRSKFDSKNMTRESCVLQYSKVKANLDDNTLMFVTAFIAYGPPTAVIVLLGCMALAIQVRRLHLRLRRMSNGSYVGSGAKTKITLVVGGIYAACSCLVFGKYIIVEEELVAGEHQPLIGEVVISVVVANCSVNFLLYCVMRQSYRTAFRELFTSTQANTSRTDTIDMN